MQKVPDTLPSWPVTFLQEVSVSRRRNLPETTAYVRITQHSWTLGQMTGEVLASQYTWHFHWRFRDKALDITPALGRALIKEPLSRFLEQKDYQLEPGGDYTFTVRAKF